MLPPDVDGGIVPLGLPGVILDRTRKRFRFGTRSRPSYQDSSPNSNALKTLPITN